MLTHPLNHPPTHPHCLGMPGRVIELAVSVKSIVAIHYTQLQASLGQARSMPSKHWTRHASWEMHRLDSDSSNAFNSTNLLPPWDTCLKLLGAAQRGALAVQRLQG